MPKGKNRSVVKLSEGKRTYECSKCAGWYSKSEFYKDERSKYGIRTTCKKCHKATGRKYFKSTKSKKTPKKSRTTKLTTTFVDVASIMVKLRNDIMSKVVPVILPIVENAVREIDKTRSEEIQNALVDRIGKILKTNLPK